MTYKSYEVTGYIVNECITLCPQCTNKLNFNTDQENVIFADTETDMPCACENCKKEIETIIIR